jgi:predicted negative regulator of RcsB-dependent stress response
MAVYDLEEQEKLDALKDWWKQHARTVLLAVAVFALTLSGIQGWRWWERSQNQQASLVYEAMQEAARLNDVKRVRDAAGQLMEGFGGTAYAAKAALLAARVNYENGDAASAKAQLGWAADKAKGELGDVARLQLAGALLDESKYDEAIKLLDGVRNEAFAALVQDLRAEVFLAQGKTEEARAAYQKAVETADPKGAYRRIVQMKLDALGDKK